MRMVFAALMAAAALTVGATPASAAAAPHIDAVVYYTIYVKTGNVGDAGTDADVYIRLIGSAGTTGYIELDNPGDDRKRNQIDTYGPMPLSDLGTLREVRIAFEPEGGSPDWYLDWVKVDSSSGRSDLFPCYCWISGDSNTRIPRA